MARMLRRWLAALLLTGILSFPVQAQAPEKEADNLHPSPVPQTTVAFLVTVLVLAVVCTPTRK